MKKKIWYISKYCEIGNKDSIGSRGWMLMKNFAKKGHEILIITSDHQNELYSNNYYPKLKKIFKKDGVKIILLNTFKYSISKSISRIISWFDFEINLLSLNKKFLPKPDIIIVSSLSLLTILNGILLKKKFRCKLVFEIRDIWPLTLIEEGGFSQYNPFILILGLIERVGYKNSDLIVGTMPKLSEHVEKILGYPKQVKCIPMGIERSMLKDKKIKIPGYIKRRFKSDHFDVVFMGTIGITNALDTFFKAAKILENNLKIRFIIVGDGSLRKKYLSIYGHLANIIYFPKIKKKQVQSFLTNADVVYFSVFKSKVWNYGQSLNKVIDYMISAKPIIASYSGYPSMINESNCGYIIPAEDHYSLVHKIRKMREMTIIERKTMGARGLKWVLKNRLYDKLSRDYLSFLLKSGSK